MARKSASKEWRLVDLDAQPPLDCDIIGRDHIAEYLTDGSMDKSDVRVALRLEVGDSMKLYATGGASVFFGLRRIA